jgi:AcrR family transcriptional regulator
VTTEYSGSGDPARTMELLWGVQDRRPRRGPKPRLTVAKIARAAIEVADAEGLAALTMRRVADALGVTAMSLYTYVPGKAELIDVMFDAAYGELPLPDDEPDDEPGSRWRARLELVARENWAMHRRHPWMLQVATTRPVLGPNLMAKYDQELRAVADIGLTEVEMDLLVTLVSDYVYGAVRGAVESAQVEQRTGMSDAEWWSVHAPLLEKVFDHSRYPIAARVGAVAGATYEAAYDPDRAFEFGLQRVLDGIEAFIRSAQGKAPP